MLQSRTPIEPLTPKSRETLERNGAIRVLHQRRSQPGFGRDTRHRGDKWPVRLAASACMIGGFAAQSLSRSATWSQTCLRVSDDGSDWLDSLPYFSCPAHTGRRPTALPRTIVWLPQPRPHRREAIGSIVLICRVRSNAGTCGCSDNLSKKQVHETGPRLLRTCPLRTCPLRT